MDKRTHFRKLHVFLCGIMLIAIITVRVDASNNPLRDRYGPINRPDNSETGTSNGNPGNLSGWTEPTVPENTNITNSGNTSIRSGRKPQLTITHMTLKKAAWNTVTLVNASKKGVSWYSTNKSVKLKKNGNSVDVIWAKSGTCYVKARYKNKTYSCKVICSSKPYTNVFRVSTHGPVNLDCSASEQDDALIEILYWKVGGRIKGSSLRCQIEDPNIVTCTWGKSRQSSYYSFVGAINLYIGALRPGKTRVILSNDYNQEKEIITVLVSNVSGVPLIEKNQNYDPFSDTQML